MGVRYNALSVDHLEKTTDAEIEVLRGSETMPTMLPGCSFFLGLPYGRAKEYIQAGLPVLKGAKRCGRGLRNLVVFDATKRDFVLLDQTGQGERLLFTKRLRNFHRCVRVVHRAVRRERNPKLLCDYP